jgi:hypothetical protein
MGSEPGCATNSRRWSLVVGRLVVDVPRWESNTGLTGPLDRFVGLYDWLGVGLLKPNRHLQLVVSTGSMFRSSL